MKKRIGWIILGIIVIIIGIKVYTVLRERAEFLKQESIEKKIAVKVVSPASGYIANSLKFLGTVKGENQVQIFPDVPGRLLRYTVKEGQSVQKNHIIALIDRSMPGMEYEPATVRSPIRGVVVRLLLDNGMAVASQVPVAIIADSRKKVVAINIGEKFLPKIKKGMKASIVSDQYPDKKIPGKILRVSPFVDPMTRSAYCEVSISKPQGITLGSFANVFIHLEEKTDALLLPRRALIEDITTGENYVFVVKDDKAFKVAVELGIVNENKIEILNELSAESQIITLGKEYLKDGDLIEVIE
jgi:multidrug efflux pump subunit AcrA (membrane-fusion protein)